jgi:phosphoglycerol transferase MdoB-like AlkP superfamily enzyme
VHPYPASFYARDTVYPLLGFDDFIDVRQFDGVAKTGPYVGDAALADAVCALLQADAAQPLFVFVITMENHGPLHLESVQPGDVARLYHTPPPAGCEELTIYLRHLVNADAMARRLRTHLMTLPGDGVLCWYGDHVPILPKVYAALGTPDGQTDYFIWSKNARGQRAASAMPIDQLATQVITAMGFPGAAETAS